MIDGDQRSRLPEEVAQLRIWWLEFRSLVRINTDGACRLAKLDRFVMKWARYTSKEEEVDGV